MVRFSRGIIFVVLAVFIVVACNHSSKKVRLVLHDSLVLTIHKPIPFFCTAMFYKKIHDTGFLFVDDKSNQEIRVFNLTLKTEIDPIPLSDTGIHAIPYNFGFFVKSMDSVYLPGPFHNIYLINRYGEVVKNVDFSSLKAVYPELTFAESLSRFTKGAVLIGNELFLLQSDNRSFYYSNAPSSYHFLLKYNISNDSIGLSPIALPDQYWKDGKRDMSVSMTYNNQENRFIFGTKCSDFILTSRDGMRVDNVIHSKSNAIKEYFPYTAVDELSSQDYFYALCKYAYNVGLIWDSNSKSYYRFVWPGIDSLDPGDSKRVNEVYANFPTFSIDILNRDFETIGTISLPENKYSWNNYFISEHGLCLAVTNSPKDFEKLHWTFHIYRPEE